MDMNETLIPTGCYLDSHRGHYITRDAILLAIDYGFVLDAADRQLVDTYDAECWDPGYDFESLVDLSDEAITWMNEMVCNRPENTYWGWNDGDFGLYEEEDFEC